MSDQQLLLFLFAACSPFLSLAREQCNHREWADFFVDLYLVEGRSGFLSRMAVLVVFPVFAFYGILSKTAVFFKRNKSRDARAFAQFNQRITQQIARGPCT